MSRWEIVQHSLLPYLPLCHYSLFALIQCDMLLHVEPLHREPTAVEAERFSFGDHLTAAAWVDQAGLLTRGSPLVVFGAGLCPAVDVFRLVR
jgi:hypothetical protein